MKQQATQRIRLGARDRAILRYIGDQGMSWTEALHSIFYGGREIHAVRSTLRRLTGAPPHYRYLRPEPLDGKRLCYQLTPRAARMLGFDVQGTRPLGRRALLRRYALQWFLEVDGKDRRRRCEPRDYPELFPVQANELARANFFLEKTAAATQLGLVVEDTGCAAHRMVRRATDLFGQLLTQSWFDGVLANEPLLVTFLTIADEKGERLRTQFERAVQTRLRPVLRQISGAGEQQLHAEYMVVPGLLEIIGTQP